MLTSIGSSPVLKDFRSPALRVLDELVSALEAKHPNLLYVHELVRARDLGEVQRAAGLAKDIVVIRGPGKENESEFASSRADLWDYYQPVGEEERLVGELAGCHWVTRRAYRSEGCYNAWQ